MSTINGFLLTRQNIDRTNGTDLEFWFYTDQGPVQLVQTRHQCVFFVEENSHTKAYDICSSLLAYHRPLNLKSFNQIHVLGYYFKQVSHMRKAAKLLKEHGIEPLEYDVRVTDRYLMERFITADALIQATHNAAPPNNAIKAHNAFSFTQIYDAKIKPSEPLNTEASQNTPSTKPNFNIASFDIETNYKTGDILSIAVYASNAQQIFMLSTHDHIEQNDDVITQFVTHEQRLLESFLAWIQHNDPDILIGWNCINFDLRILQKACDKAGIPFALGRNNQTIEWRTSPNSPNQYFTLIPGRAVLDGIDTLKSATFNFESFSLEYVSRSLFSSGKLIHDVNDRGDEIIRLFQQDKKALGAYNLEDCHLVWRIFEHCKLIDFAVERARLTGLPIDKVGGSVMAFENQYLPILHRQGYVAPNIPSKPIGVGSPGGYVMNSTPGIYNNVLVLDFKSLYPSIIRSFKIDPYGLTEADQLLNNDKNQHSHGHPEDIDFDQLPYNTSLFSKGYRGTFFKREGNILPNLIEKLWHARDKAKRSKNAAMSQAIKIIMNSFYGVMGTPGCRFFDRRLPSSITLRGHQIMSQTKSLIEQQGYEVIYGDTDSIFVHINEPVSHQQAAQIGNHLAQTITLWWQEHLASQYRLNSALELEFENHFSKFLMPTIRGSDKGSKKRYAGLKTTEAFSLAKPDPADFELVFKGLETVRTDWTLLARQFQKELFKRIFLEQEYEEYIHHTLKALKTGEHDNQLIYRKRLRRKLSEYQNNIPPHAQAAKKADQYYINDGKAPRYQHGGWVSYCYTVNGPETADLRQSPLDYELYIERQIIPIVDSILCFKNQSFSQLFSDQLSLI